MVLPALYNFFSKVFMIFGTGSQDEKVITTSLGISPFFIKDYMMAARNYNYQGIEKILLLLHQYNLRSLGIRDAGTDDAELLKEMIVKMMS
jgi:DNA polymerase-3 subunit delta